MRRKLGLVLLVMVCFAFNSLATRALVHNDLLDAASLTAARFAAGAVTLAALVAAQTGVRDAMPGKRDLGAIAALGIYALAIAYGYQFITAAAGTFVFYAFVIAAMAFGGARPSLRAAVGALLALAGVAVLAFGRAAGTQPLGVALLALTGASWGAYSLVLRKRGSPVATNARAFVGVALLVPLLLFLTRDHLVWSWQGIAVGVFMGSITTALAYALWARVLPGLTSLEAGTVQLLVPILTASAGVAFLGEPFGARLALAAVLVLAGMILVQSPRPSRA